MGYSRQSSLAFHGEKKVNLIEKRYLPAQIHLRSALKLNKDSTLYNLLGICLSQLKDFGNAEKAFEEAVRM